MKIKSFQFRDTINDKKVNDFLKGKDVISITQSESIYMSQTGEWPEPVNYINIVILYREE